MRDFEAHVARFFEYTTSNAAMGLGDCFVGVVFYKLRRAETRLRCGVSEFQAAIKI